MNMKGEISGDSGGDDAGGDDVGGGDGSHDGENKCDNYFILVEASRELFLYRFVV